MKQFLINVPDDKQHFFKELMDSLNFSVAETGMVNEPVPEWHKELVSKRFEEASEEDFVSWDEAKKKLNRK